MGLFGSKKKQEMKAREREMAEYDRQKAQENRVLNEMAKQYAKAGELVSGERVLLCGKAMFTNMVFNDYVKNGAQKVEMLPLLTMEPDAILAKCEAFQPTLLILTCEVPELPTFAEQIARNYPALKIVASAANPEALPYAQAKLEASHVSAVLPTPCSVQQFIEAMER